MLGLRWPRLLLLAGIGLGAFLGTFLTLQSLAPPSPAPISIIPTAPIIAATPPAGASPPRPAPALAERATPVTPTPAERTAPNNAALAMGTPPQPAPAAPPPMVPAARTTAEVAASAPAPRSAMEPAPSAPEPRTNAAPALAGPAALAPRATPESAPAPRTLAEPAPVALAPRATPEPAGPPPRTTAESAPTAPTARPMTEATPAPSAPPATAEAAPRLGTEAAPSPRPVAEAARPAATPAPPLLSPTMTAPRSTAEQAPPAERSEPARSAASPAPTSQPEPAARPPAAIASVTPETAPPAAPAPTPTPPRFDVVRIGSRGTAVIAGRGAAGAEILLLANGERELGRARADRRGEWVLLPADPLPPGTHVLALRARLAGTETAGPDTVVVVVPEPAPVALDLPRPDAGGALAVLIPPSDAEATPRLLQTPTQASAGRAPAAAAAPPSPPAARLGLESVDYADAGGMRFSGTAQPGAAVRAYVGDRHAGDAVANAEGRWSLVPSDVPAIGRHTLRLDQIAASGTVAARAEFPFQRDSVAPERVAGGRIVVQPGQSLWRIARENYGQGLRYTTIYEANRDQIRDADRIFPGQVFSVPGPSAPPASNVSR